MMTDTITGPSSRSGELQGNRDSKNESGTKESPIALSSEEFLFLVGSRVRHQRVSLGMSRKLLSENSGVSERYLSQLETGQGNMSITLLRRVAQAIDMHVGKLLDDDHLATSWGSRQRE